MRQHFQKYHLHVIYSKKVWFSFDKKRSLHHHMILLEWNKNSKGSIYSQCLRISIASYTYHSNEIYKQDFGLRKEKVLLKLRFPVETYLKHCF